MLFRSIQQAIREYDRFMSDEQYVPKVDPLLQNSQAHYIQHRKDAMSQEFEQLETANPQRAILWSMHVENTAAAILSEMVSTGGALQGGTAPAQGGVAGSLPGSSGAATTGEPTQVKKGRAAVAEHRDTQAPAEPAPKDALLQ